MTLIDNSFGAAITRRGRSVLLCLLAVNPLRVLCVSTEVPQQRESKSHQTLQPAKLKAVSLFEELTPNPPPLEATDKYCAHTKTQKTHRQTD